MEEDYSIAVTELLLKLLKQDIKIPEAIDGITGIIKAEVEKRCDGKQSSHEVNDGPESSVEPVDPADKSGDLDIKEASRILDFMNYFRSRLSKDDPLYPLVNVFNDMIHDLDNQNSLKDRQISCALKSTYLCDRKDLQRNRGNAAVQTYQNLLEEDPGIDIDSAAISRSTYYDAMKNGKDYFLYRCNSLLDGETIAEIRKFIYTADQIRKNATRPIAYRDRLTQWMKSRENADKKK